MAILVFGIPGIGIVTSWGDPHRKGLSFLLLFKLKIPIGQWSITAGVAYKLACAGVLEGPLWIDGIYYGDYSVKAYDGNAIGFDYSGMNITHGCSFSFITNL
jgi:hypothetical protein